MVIVIMSLRAQNDCKLAASTMEEDGQEEEKKIVSMALLGFIQTNVGEQPNGRMYLKPEVTGKRVQATQEQMPCI